MCHLLQISMTASCRTIPITFYFGVINSLSKAANVTASRISQPTVKVLPLWKYGQKRLHREVTRNASVNARVHFGSLRSTSVNAGVKFGAFRNTSKIAGVKFRAFCNTSLGSCLGQRQIWVSFLNALVKASVNLAAFRNVSVNARVQFGPFFKYSSVNGRVNRQKRQVVPYS